MQNFVFYFALIFVVRCFAARRAQLKPLRIPLNAGFVAELLSPTVLHTAAVPIASAPAFC